MLITDAANEVILATNYRNMNMRVDGNMVSIADEFGTMKRTFTETDPALIQKMRQFWSDFLANQTRKYVEQIQANRETEVWYEVHADNEPTEIQNTKEDALKCAENFKTMGKSVDVFRLSKEKIF